MSRSPLVLGDADQRARDRLLTSSRRSASSRRSCHGSTTHPAILPSRTTTRQFDLPGLGRRRDLLQRGGVEADGLGRDDVPVRAGDGRARRGGRRRRRARRSGAACAVVVAGARRTDDERDDGREREGCRPTTRTADSRADPNGRRRGSDRHQGTHRFGLHRDFVVSLAMTAADTRSAVAHLARRAGFGLAADEIDALAAGGYAAAVDAVCADLVAPDAAAEAVAPPTFDRAAYRQGRMSDDAATREGGGSTSPDRAPRPRGLVAATHGCRRSAGAREGDVPLARPLLDELAEGEARRARCSCSTARCTAGRRDGSTIS